MKERGERGGKQKNKGCKQTEVNYLIFVPQMEFEKEKGKKTQNPNQEGCATLDAR